MATKKKAVKVKNTIKSVLLDLKRRGFPIDKIDWLEIDGVPYGYLNVEGGALVALPLASAREDGIEEEAVFPLSAPVRVFANHIVISGAKVRFFGPPKQIRLKK